MSDVTDLIGRVRYILDPTASASERLHRRSHLTNRDLRTIVAALERITRTTDDVVEAARKAIVSYVFSETQPDRGDVFSWLDDHAEQIACAALSTIKQTDAVEAETYRQMHETAKELGYPSILEALEHLDELKQTDAVEAAIERCARIAEAYPTNDYGDGLVAKAIAAAIRGAK